MGHNWLAFGEGRHPRLYTTGEFIYLQGTEATAFYYLVSGTARSFISSVEGTERILTVHHNGSLMGEASFFDECPRVSSAIAVTECQIISVSRAQLTGVFDRHPELAFPMLQYLARTVRLLSTHVNEISFYPARERIIRYLLSLYRNAPLNCTQEEISAAVGASRVTVSRVLGALSRDGLLKTGYGFILLTEPARLEAELNQ